MEYMCICIQITTHTHTHTHTHTQEYHSDTTKNEIMPFGATWVDLEGIMLSEISQTEKYKFCMTMASHSSILAWRIPWMEEPGRLQSTGSQRVRHDWATSLHFYDITHIWNLKIQHTGENNKIRSTYRYREETIGYQTVRKGGSGNIGEGT